jgi:hypothetical protein
LGRASRDDEPAASSSRPTVAVGSLCIGVVKRMQKVDTTPKNVMLNKVKHLGRIVRVSDPSGASEMLHSVQHDVLGFWQAIRLAG